MCGVVTRGEAKWRVTRKGHGEEGGRREYSSGVRVPGVGRDEVKERRIN